MALRPNEQQINAGLLELRDKLADKIADKGGEPDSTSLNTLADSIDTIPQGGGIPVVDPPSGDFYAAIAYFTGENGDYDNIAYAFANNSTEFNSQFCHSTLFANFTLHSTAGGSDSVVIPNNKMFGFYFGSQFNLTALPNYFLAYCYSFDQPLILPEGIVSIGGYLLYASSFNQPLTLPSSLTGIGDRFLNGCPSFNQPLTLPEGLVSFGTHFLNNDYSFDRLIANCAVSPTDTASLATTSSEAAMFVNGIKVSGTYAQTWIDNLPNNSASGNRRNLILAP